MGDGAKSSMSLPFSRHIVYTKITLSHHNAVSNFGYRKHHIGLGLFIKTELFHCVFRLKDDQNTENNCIDNQQLIFVIDVNVQAAEMRVVRTSF